MVRLLSALFVMILSGSPLYAETPLNNSINITIVDIDDNEFPIESLSWWYVGDRNSKQSLHCLNKLCSKWVFTKKNNKPIILSANTSVAVKDDASCWLLYKAEKKLNTRPAVVKIKIKSLGKVCK